MENRSGKWDPYQAVTFAHHIFFVENSPIMIKPAHGFIVFSLLQKR